MKKNLNLLWLIIICISGLNADVSEKALSLDFSSAIPLRGHVYRDNQFAVSLTGSAIKGVYESNFDTGSWTTSLPYGCLDKNKITVLKRNVRDCWGNLADLVKGQLILTSSDGNTKYSVDNYEFYAMKNSNGTDMPDDRTAKWSSSIVGAFPSDNSLPMAIAKKYSTNGIALGIISEAASDNIGADWSTFKSYLKIGNDPNLNSNLNWRNNANFHCPAGFKATLQFPSVNGTTVPDIVCSDLLATCDTGAPDLTMRLKSDDPQRRAPYQQFFDPNLSPSWYGPAKAQGAKPGVTIKFDFTGSSGKTDSWKFTTANSGYVPNTCYIGDWSAGVPWSVTDHTPINRINMGNSIYFYCPVFYWDVTNNRVGIYTKNSNSSTNVALNKPTSQSSVYPSGDSYKAVDGKIDGAFLNNSVTHTNCDSKAWWKVDLQREFQINKVKIYNRNECSDRLSNFHVDLLDQNGNIIVKQDFLGTAGTVTEFNFTTNGVYGVRVQLNGTNFLSLAEVKVYGVPTDPAGYTKCANENQSFTLPGICDVAYGANGKFYYQYGKTGTISFNNSTFGDPIPGVAKYGYYKKIIITSNDVLGFYTKQPIQNNWHAGVIEMSGSTIQWRNNAGVTWPLIPDLANGKLLTTSLCPYYNQSNGKAFILKTKTVIGRVIIEGFWFQDTYYSISSNIALGKGTNQSSTVSNGASSRAVDGNTSGLWDHNSVTHTDYNAGAWWWVDLGTNCDVNSVILWNRTECPERLSNFHVDFLNQNGTLVARKDYSGTAGSKTVINLSASGVKFVVIQLNGTNYLSLAEVQVMGNVSGSNPGGQTDIAEKVLPKTLELAQNYPNPFNPTTTIKFTLPENGNVKLAVMNAKGEIVKVLANGNHRAGNHSFDFDGSDLNSGVYFYQLTAPQKTITKKMILIK